MSTPKLRAIAAALVLASISTAPLAITTPNTTTFMVKATVVVECSVSVLDLDFGSFTSLSSDNVKTTTLTVDCPSTVSWHASASAGMGAGATFLGRKLTGPGTTVPLPTIDYNLYIDSSFTPWGDGTGGSSTLDGDSVVGTSTMKTIYGRIPAAAAPDGTFLKPPAGSYNDTITVTLSF